MMFSVHLFFHAHFAAEHLDFDKRLRLHILSCKLSSSCHFEIFGAKSLRSLVPATSFFIPSLSSAA
jgi:hypothetical protein